MRIIAEHTNHGRVVLIGCLSILFVVGVVGCSKQTPPAQEANEPAPTTAVELTAPAEVATPAPETTPIATPAPAPDAAVVTVNGEEITEQRLNAAVDLQVQRAGSQLANMPAAIVDRFKQQMRQRVIDGLVAETLVDQQIKAANIVVTDEQVVAAIEAQGAKQSPPITVDNFKAMVEAQGGNFDEVKSQYKANMARQQFLETQWAGKIDVNDTAVQAYYDENPKEFEQPEQLQASHILIKPVADANDPNEAKATAKAKAEQLLTQLKDGADFAELAQANSDCPSAKNGGDLGLFGRSQMVKPFEEAAFALQPGEMSDLVETQFGYHIIKVTDRKEARTSPFEEAKADIFEKLTGQKKRQFAEEYLRSLKENATIVYAPGAEPAAPAPMAPAPVPTTSEN